jgi:glyoxylase-like metal-dependent hydrolase (beta-lactamase superfamily II)
MKQILPNLYYITGLPVGRVYVIDDADGLTVIDTSLPGQTNHILAQTKTLNKPVKRLLLTHAHPDHVGSLPELKAATGAQLIVHELEKPVVEGQIPIPRVPPEELGVIKLRPPHTVLKPTPVDQVVVGGETLAIMGGLEVVFTPGHAPGHISFWQPQHRLLFSGDVLFNMTKMGLPFRMLTVDMAENKRSIRKVAKLDPAIICFGHGEPVRDNAAQRLHALAQQVAV